MLSNDKKMAVITVLRQMGQGLSLPELLSKLGPEYKERTLRRWLSYWIDEGIVEKSGLRKNARYFVPLEKENALTYVNQPIYQRKPVEYHEEWLKSYQPNTTTLIPLKTKEQLWSAGHKENGQEAAGTYARHIYNRLLIELSYNSSRLEGNTYSLLETRRLILEGESAKGKLDTEKVMILNHKEAIRYLVDNAKKITISPPVICTLHYLLSDGLVANKYAGKARDHGVRIGGSTYIPIENHKHITELLNRICEIGAEINDPFEQSFFLLIHLSYLQAFIDVNKRTARLSCNIPFIKNNLVPLSFDDVAQDDYISALLAVYELNNTGPLLELFVFSYLTNDAKNSPSRIIDLDGDELATNLFTSLDFRYTP